MSTISPDRLGPYLTRAELAKGKRKAIVGLVVAVAATGLAVVASRTVDDHGLVVVYLAAGALHFVAAVGASIRWSRTPAFRGSD
jgi:hypothetical protein